MSSIKPKMKEPETTSLSTRLDVVVSEQCGITRSQAQKKIKSGLVIVNKKLLTKPSEQVTSGDIITLLEKPEIQIQEPIIFPPISILEETQSFLVINKPSGILVHPTQAKEGMCITAWLLETHPDVALVGDSPERPGIVHRLDKEASGLLVIAKTQSMFECLKSQFKMRTVEKIYSVLVHGVIDDEHGTIDFDIGRSADGRMASRPNTDMTLLRNVGKEQEGKEALTEYWVERRFARHTLLKVKIHTGRTHQIRVHMFAIGHPVVGDPLYKQKKLIKAKEREITRLFLHARVLSFRDEKNEEHTYHAGLPDTLANFLLDLHERL